MLLNLSADDVCVKFRIKIYFALKNSFAMNKGVISHFDARQRPSRVAVHKAYHWWTCAVSNKIRRYFRGDCYQQQSRTRISPDCV